MVDEDEIHRMANSADVEERRKAMEQLLDDFASFSDKDTAWSDLRRLTQDDDKEMQLIAAYVLGHVFSEIPDKDTAWSDLIQLTHDENKDMQLIVTSMLAHAFSHIPNKDTAWSDLIRLTHDENEDVRLMATDVLAHAFSHIPNKDAAWSDLIRLIQDENKETEFITVSVIDRVFSEIPDKDTAWSDLIRLTQDENKDTRFIAAYTLGPVFSYIPNNDAAWSDLHRLTQDEKEEARWGAANALGEAQKPLDFGETKEHLMACRQHCDHTAELAGSARGKSPVAAAVIMRGIPIVGVKIKKIIAEIQEKAEALCKQTKDTPLEPLGLEAHEKAKQLSPDNVLSFDSLSATALDFCDYLPLEKRSNIYTKIQTERNLNDITEKGNIIGEIFGDIFNDIDIPRLNHIHISETKKNVVRIATVQLNFQLADSFPPTLVEKDETKKKILSALEIAKNEGAEIACLPELCIHEEWIEEIGNQFSDMIIIPGSYYDSNNYNTCQLSLESDIGIQPQRKITPSAFEDSRVMGSRMTCGEKIINIYQTQFGSFAILICRDFGNYIHYLRGKVDIVFVPSYNPANARFHKDADSHITNSPSYAIISNTALYGGTSIFGQLDFKHFNALEQGGCKEKGDRSYKLCEMEKDKEGIIIADFNLNYKSPQKQNPISPDEEIISVENIKKIYI